jgi:hypothetical protein
LRVPEFAVAARNWRVPEFAVAARNWRVPEFAVAARNWIESSGVGSCSRELD